MERSTSIPTFARKRTSITERATAPASAACAVTARPADSARAKHAQSRAALRSALLGACLVLGPLACASQKPAPATSEPPPPAPAGPPAAEVAEAPPAEPAAPEPTEEERQAQAAAERLAQEFAQMRAEADQELARWTPELRAKAQALATKKYGSLQAAVAAAQAGEHRKPGHRERDVYRHPAETLQFFGLKPTHTVLEYGPGEGWYTELLAPILASQGRLIVTSTDPKGPEDVRATLYAERLDRFLSKSPEIYGKVERAIFDPASPKLGLEGTVDVALVIRGMHGWVRDDKVDLWLGEIHKALKPGGTLGIVQHRAAPGADPKESAPSGYLPEAFVVERVEANGFKLAGRSEVNANPKDTRDHEGGVWALPPSLRNGDKDREKYLAIGESDRMTLRFTKVAK